MVSKYKGIMRYLYSINHKVILRNGKARIVHHGKKIRITLDVAEELIKEIDGIRESIGVDRGALIKVWLHERVQQEKAAKH
jgi:hypothetical protein